MFKKLISNDKIYFIAVELVSKSLLFLLIPVYRHSLNDDEYSIYASNFLAVGFISIFVAFSASSAVIPYWKAGNSKRKDSLTRAISLLVVVSMLVAIPLAIIYNVHYASSGAIYILLEAVLLYVLQYINLLNRLTNNIRMYLVNAFGHSLFVVLGSFLLLQHVNSSTRIELSIAASIILIIIYYSSEYSGKYAIKIKDWRLSLKLIRYSIPVVVFLITSFIRSGYERVFAAKLFNPSELAEILYAGQLGTPIAVLISSIIVALSPELFGLIKRNSVKKYFAINLVFLIFAPIIATAYVLIVSDILDLMNISIPNNKLNWALVSSLIVYSSCAGITTVYMYSKLMTRSLALIGVIHAITLVAVYEYLRYLDVGVFYYLLVANLCVLMFYIFLLTYIFLVEKRHRRQ